MIIGRVNAGAGKMELRKELGFTIGHNHWAYNLDVYLWRWFLYVEIEK